MNDTIGVSLAWLEHGAADEGEAIVTALAAGGVDRLFFTSGSDIVFYQEAIAKAQDQGRMAPALVSVPHEHVSLNAALGYSAVSGRPAAVAVHADVGTQHLGAAIHTASQARLPVVITAGAPPAATTGTMRGARDEGGHLWLQQTFDQNAIMRPYVKWDHRLDYQDNAGAVVSRAVQVAMTEPSGPVYLSIPRELALLKPRATTYPSARQLGIPIQPVLDPTVARQIAERLASAREPVIVIGGAGRDPAFLPALVELSERLGAAVICANTCAYLGFPFDHPLYTDSAVLRGSDAVLVIDAAVPWIPGRDSPPEDAWVAAIGLDPIQTRIPTYEFTANLRAMADPTEAVSAIAAAAEAPIKPLPDRAARMARHRAAADARNDAAEQDAADAAGLSPIGPVAVSAAIGRLLDDNCILLDETTPTAQLRRFLRCRQPGSYLACPGSSGGWSPGAALGAKIAAPKRDVIAVTGDGFYMFSSAAVALWTAVQQEAPFLMIVYQNRSYSTGTVRLAGTYPGGFAQGSGFPGGYFDPPIDFAAEAEAAGALGENVRDPAAIDGALARGLAAVRAGRPAVIAFWMQRLMAED